MLSTVWLRDWIRDDGRYLDVGCGTGGFLEWARAHLAGHWTGLDSSLDACLRCQERGLAVEQGDAMQLPYEDNSLDGITCLDVLEHLEEPVGALSELRRVLKHGGRILLTVPAHPHLWSYHDENLGHQKRYTAKLFKQEIERSGLVVERLSYAHALLYPVIFVKRHMSGSGRDKSDTKSVWRPLNLLLDYYYRMEAFFLAKTGSIPLGSSLMAVGRKE